MDPVTRNSTVTETTCDYCGGLFTPNPRARTPQRFCSTKHRVYFHREGGGIATTQHAAVQPSSNSVADALTALGGVQLPESKTAAAITVERSSAYPTGWTVTVPARSALAADKIRDAIREHADDLMTLARLIDQAANPPKAASPKPPAGRAQSRGGRVAR